MIAVSVSDVTDPAAITTAIKTGAHVAELRIDRYSDIAPDAVVAHTKQIAAEVPTLATIRSKAEGGEWPGSDEQRLELYNQVLPEVDAVDIELSSTSIRSDVVSRAHDLGKTVIASYHNFDATPPQEELDELVADAGRLNADYVKVSTMARTLNDVRSLAEFTVRWRHIGVIVIAMGSVGVSSRIFFPVLGSRLTYASLTHQGAPGQLDFATTADLMQTFYPRGKTV